MGWWLRKAHMRHEHAVKIQGQRRLCAASDDAGSDEVTQQQQRRVAVHVIVVGA